MATVNKASLRTEFDALKARFESLCAAGKMSAESRALVDALLMLFELLMAVFMEKHTPKSPANSGLPPSQSPNDATARTRPGAKGKGPSYNEARCANTRTREHVRVLGVDSCARCGEDLTDTACTGHERRTLVDIVFEKVVRHADAEIKHCTRCHTETRARFPAEMPGPLQYGPGIKAYVVHLLIAQMLSLKRVAQSMHALIGQLLSEATLLGYIAQLHHALWPSGNTKPSSASSHNRRCTSTRPRCAWTERITGFTSTPPRRSPSNASIPNAGARPLRTSASSRATAASRSTTAGPLT